MKRSFSTVPALTLIIDLQSNLIRGSLVDLSISTNPVTIYSTATPISHKDHVNGAYITKMMLKAVENLALHIMKEGLPVINSPIKSVHFVMSSPWVISESKVVKIDYDKNTEITAEIIKNIISDEKNRIVKEYESDDMIFIEQKVFDIKLNGYLVENPNSKKAKSLSMSLASSLSSIEITKRVHESVQKTFYIKEEYYHSSILLQYAALRSVIGSDEDYIVVHVHGELTDIIIVKNGLCSKLASFPFGALTLTRKVAMSMKVSFETADSNISLYEGDKLDDTHKARVEKSLFGIMKGWQSECVKVFGSENGSDKAVPRKIYFSTGEGHSGVFKKVLKEINFEIIPESHSLIDLYILALKDVI